jgi:hypothetical protein
MNTLVRAALAIVVSVHPVQAESLRCNGAIASEGDSRLSVLYKCGEPVLVDSSCAPVHYPGSLFPVPRSIAGAFVPCQQVEEWLYDRGAGNFMAIVTFRDGRVQSIRYGRVPE